MAMIRKVALKNFKRFADVTFVLPGHLVLAGPNNTGKTTLLQAIAAWSLGLLEWKKLGQPKKVNVTYAWADMERLASDPNALVDECTVLLTGNGTGLPTRASMVAVVAGIPANQARLRVQTAMQMVASSHAFIVQR
jgi:ATPase subunit of ABC transporter with duplicated ATPase domains